MAATDEKSVASRREAGVPKQKKYFPRVDMTPMVDLGFLLITFFIMTTELAKPTVIDLYMTRDGTNTDLGESSAMTVLVDNSGLFYYSGKWEDALRENRVKRTYYSGENNIRDAIAQQQRSMDNNVKVAEGREGLMVLIKPTKGASYKEVVDMLDEMSISRVKKYALVKLSGEELEWLDSNKEE